MPKVSVIIPVYGVEKYIERCARSLFEQTLDDIEYLFIDDCTSDNSICILKHILKEYPYRKDQVIIHRMSVNSGQASVRKWGMEHVKGDYVIHCDSDDWLELDTYEKLYIAAINENADIVRCYFDRVSDTNTNKASVIFGGIYFEKIKLIEQLFVGNDLSSLCDKLVSKELYKKITVFPNDNMWEDVLLCTQFIISSNKIVCVPEYLYHYRVHESSIVHNSSLDASLKRFHQTCSNVDKVIIYLKSQDQERFLLNGLDCLKRRAKNQLLPYISKKNIYKQWKNTYKEINYRLFLNPLLSTKAKIAHILVLLHLYPFL